MSKRLLLITAAATWLTAVLPVEAFEPTKPSVTVDIQASSEVGRPCFGFGFVFDREVVKSGATVVPFSIPDGKVLSSPVLTGACRETSPIRPERHTCYASTMG